MNLLKPAYIYASVVDIPLDQLVAQRPDLRGLSWDLDGTLVEHLGDDVPEAHLDVIRWADQLELSQAIISNAHTESRALRLQQVAAQICNRTGVDLVTIGSREVNARKPKPAIFRAAAEHLGLLPAEVLHTGDQIARDIVGPNLARFMGGILVAPYGGTADEGWPVRNLQRPVERVVRTTMKVPFSDSKFPRALE
jgi:predicted HAD superfamily phosphohydrolase YqeG